ncbi:MAG: PAS domain S-box protein [Acidobacteria bacterium]|nr:PAS domain S-box protein [Acidobacteriota bacterium]
MPKLTIPSIGILEHAPMAILILDSRGEGQWANDRAKALFSFDTQGRLCWLETLHSEDQKFMLEHLKRGQLAQPIQRELLMLSKGQASWFQVSLRWLSELIEGQAGFVCYFEDISAHKSIEHHHHEVSQYLDALLNATEYSVIATEPDGIIKFFNRAAESLLGYRAEEVVGKETPAIIHVGAEVAQRAAALSQALKKPVEPGFDTFVVKAREQRVADRNEWTYVRKDGSKFPVMLSVTAMRNLQDEVVGYLGIASDISEQKKKEAEHLKMAALLREAGRLAKLGGWELDLESMKPTWSEQVYQIHEVEPDFEPSLEDAIGFYREDYREELEQAIQLVSLTGQSLDLEFALVTAQYREIWVRVIINAERDEAGHIYRLFGTMQDITHQRELELRMREYKKLFDLSGEPVCIAGFNGRFLDINPAWQRVLGWSEEELLNRPFLDFIHPEDVERTLQTYDGLLKYGGEVSGFVNRYRTDQGQYRWLSWSAYSDVNEKRIYCVTHDITEKLLHDELLNEALKESANFKFAMDQAGLVSITDVQGNITFCNEYFCRVSEYSPKELIGANHRIIKSDYHDPPFFKEMWRTIANGKVWRGEICNQTKSGRYYWVDSTIVPLLGENGKPQRYLSFRTLIDQRKKMEMALRDNQSRLLSAQRLARLGHWEFDLASRSFLRSEELLRILELTPGEDETERFWQRVHPDDRKPLEKLVLSTIRNKAKLDTEIRLVFEQGRMKYLLSMTEPVLNEEGRVIKVSGIHQDITERKLMEQELVRARDAAEAATRAKSDFLSMMSHEIRTPMNAVIGLAHLLRDDAPSGAQLENLETLLFSAENLLELINDLLDFNKIEAGKVQLEAIPFELVPLLKRMANSFFFRAEAKGIRLDLRVPMEMPAWMMGDALRLAQVLNNLLSNALKFTEEGFVRLEANYELLRSTHVRVYFAVIDSGIGIPPEKHQLIFERFMQAESDTSRRHGGTGLGLAISRGLIQLMGGDIQVVSQPGKGSTFSFSIDFALTDGPGNESHKSSSLAFDQLGVRVLLVEDNPVNVMVVSKFLGKWQVNLDHARNGQEAVTKAEHNQYDLILMDLQMPILDGYQATRQIRQLGITTPILALTADALSDGRAKAEEMGMNDYITKPFNPKELFEKIRFWVKQNV